MTQLAEALELSLWTVRALPNASSSSPDCSAASVDAPLERLTAASEARQSFVVSVLPAPLSPETRIAWSQRVSSSAACAARTRLHTCGAPSAAPSTERRTISSGVVSASCSYGLSASRIEPPSAV